MPFVNSVSLSFALEKNTLYFFFFFFPFNFEGQFFWKLLIDRLPVAPRYCLTFKGNFNDIVFELFLDEIFFWLYFFKKYFFFFFWFASTSTGNLLRKEIINNHHCQLELILDLSNFIDLFCFYFAFFLF